MNSDLIREKLQAGRWVVTRNRRGPNLQLVDGWCVLGPGYYVNRSFHTHAEALAYADRKARTREVVLPRLDPTRPVHKAPVKTQGVDNMWVKPGRDGVQIQHHFPPRSEGCKTVNTKGMYVPKHHIRPLALALLAHAERIGE